MKSLNTRVNNKFMNIFGNNTVNMNTIVEDINIEVLPWLKNIMDNNIKNFFDENKRKKFYQGSFAGKVRRGSRNAITYNNGFSGKIEIIANFDYESVQRLESAIFHARVDIPEFLNCNIFLGQMNLKYYCGDIIDRNSFEYDTDHWMVSDIEDFNPVLKNKYRCYSDKVLAKFPNIEEIIKSYCEEFINMIDHVEVNTYTYGCNNDDVTATYKIIAKFNDQKLDELIAKINSNEIIQKLTADDLEESEKMAKFYAGTTYFGD